jgi:hypothetical protein
LYRLDTLIHECKDKFNANGHSEVSDILMQFRLRIHSMMDDNIRGYCQNKKNNGTILPSFMHSNLLSGSTCSIFLKTVSISGILDVGTNGKRAWNNVHTTVLISNGRTIAISLADKETQSHFMGQQIYGIVKIFYYLTRSDWFVKLMHRCKRNAL